LPKCASNTADRTCLTKSCCCASTPARSSSTP
jgi:hypothetical protein